MQGKILFLKKNWFELFLLSCGFIYYSYFLNKGLVLYDEGYYFHIADRIIQGQLPYRDFFLQFTPGYFYILAGALKIFGEQILVGRILTLIIALINLFLGFRILAKLGTHGVKEKIIVFLATISFGFPLINNPAMLAWISILSFLLLVYSFLLWQSNQGKIRNTIFIGLSLALILFMKQNLGLYFLFVTNVFIIFIAKQKIKEFILVNFSFLLPTLIWFFYFYLHSGDRLLELINFNKAYLSIYPASYPPISMFLQPLGFFKLVPYYLPVLLVVLVLIRFKKMNLRKIFFPIASLVGFFGTVFPTSDLLHVYPFYSSILISGLIFFNKDRFYRIWIIFVIVSVGLGFYLTLFREYYRYQPGYADQNTTLNFSRTKGIEIDKPLASDLTSLNNFIGKRTSNKEYILVYPFSPMLYFILERNNPSRYSSYYPGYLTQGQEDEVINDLKVKKVRFIVTSSRYKFDAKLSGYIQKQKIVFSRGIFKVFEIY